MVNRLKKDFARILTDTMFEFNELLLNYLYLIDLIA